MISPSTATQHGVSVIIPAHNAGDFIAAAIRSVGLQTYRPVEVIVIDDASSDDTADVATQAAAAFPDLGFQLCTMPQNGGPSAARNFGIAHATHEVVAFLDADDKWEADKLALQMERLASEPGLDLVFSWYAYTGPDGVSDREVFSPYNRRYDLADLLVQNVMHTSTVLARRAAIDQAGGFETSLRAYEDYDLWLRIAALRANNMALVPQVLVTYRRWPGQATRDWRKMEAGWLEVMARQRKLHPRLVPQQYSKARLTHLVYMSSLAYHAGDTTSLRSLVRRAWRHVDRQTIRDPYLRNMTLVALRSLLPMRLQTATQPFGRLFRPREGRIARSPR